MSSHLHPTALSSRRGFASQADKDRVILALDAQIAAELARAEFLRRARLERNARQRTAQPTRSAASEGPLMRDLTRFTYGDAPVRVHLDDNGAPWFVASDVAKILGYRMASDMTRNVDEDERGTQIVRTPSGDQEMNVISESGLYSAILRSRVDGARPFKRWVTHEVLPSIRKTGTYATPSASAPAALTGEALIAAALVEAQRVLADTQAQAADAQARAEAASSTIAAIEAADGITLTAFHKHYFSEVGHKEFFEDLYSMGLLIDQRGARGRDAHGKVKNGLQHQHPTAKGKEFIYLHSSIDSEGVRRERPRVRPGEPEVRLARWLHHRGLRLNEELVPVVEASRELVVA